MKVTDLARDREGREATRLSRKSGNLACYKRPHTLRERASGVKIQLVGYDALLTCTTD